MKCRRLNEQPAAFLRPAARLKREENTMLN